MHKIKTGEHSPIIFAPYAISAVKAEGVREEVAKLLDSGIIVSSSSPSLSPVVSIVKPDESIRLCIDYRS